MSRQIQKLKFKRKLKMHNLTRISLTIILLILSSATAVFSQAQKPATNSANATGTIQAAPNGVNITSDDDLVVCNQRLTKVLEELESAEKLIANLKELSAKQTELNTANNQIIATQNGVIAAQKDLIKIYEARPRKKTKILWGLISFATN